MDEFFEDVNRVKYLKRLFSRYDQDGELKSRLIVNHLIIFNNVFGLVPSSRILFYKVDEKYYSLLKTCLYYIERLPTKIPEIEIDNVPLNHIVLNKLREDL